MFTYCLDGGAVGDVEAEDMDAPRVRGDLCAERLQAVGAAAGDDHLAAVAREEPRRRRAEARRRAGHQHRQRRRCEMARHLFNPRGKSTST